MNRVEIMQIKVKQQEQLDMQRITDLLGSKIQFDELFLFVFF